MSSDKPKLLDLLNIMQKMKPSITTERFIYSFYSVLGKGNELHTSSLGLSIGKVARRSYLRISNHRCPSKKNEYLLCLSISSINAASNNLLRPFSSRRPRACACMPSINSSGLGILPIDSVLFFIKKFRQSIFF